MSVNEPSMEDILASIRRIIAEDQSNNLGRAGLGGLTRRQPAPSSPAEDVAPPRPTEAPFEAAPVAPAFHPEPQAEAFAVEVEVPHPVSQEDVMADPIMADHAVAEADEPGPFMDHHALEVLQPQHAPSVADEGVEPLMSPLAGASITSSFQTLAETVMLQDPDLIERVMRDSMRPLLKAWLDDHLPSIVERLVRTEIERVARGGRGWNA